MHGWEISYGQSLFSVITNGHFAVNIFFVLSGFVLSKKYFLTNNFNTLVSAAQRRYLRLYIPVAFTLILSFAIMHLHIFYNIPASKISKSFWLDGMWSFTDSLKNLIGCLTYRTMFLNDSMFDTSMWTISIELFGSAFIFALLALTHNTKSRIIIMILLLLFFYFTEDQYYSDFIFGISLNYVGRSGIWLNKYLSNFTAFILLIIGLILGAFPSNNVITHTFISNFPGSKFVGGWYHNIGAYFLVLSFVIAPFLQRLIDLRFFRFLGYISFSLYLLHPLIIGSFSSFIFLKLYHSCGYNYSVAIVFILTTCFCLYISWLMTKYIDIPSTGFSKYVYDRWIKKM